jgi:type IX secretion system PorP/SprF family membrane protein
MKTLSIISKKLSQHLLVCVVFIIILFFVSNKNKLAAQQDPLYSQYMFNYLSINPAYAGSVNVLSLTAVTRHQWVGIDGAPVTQSFSIHSPIKAYNIGLGINLFRDKSGPISNNAFQVNFSYKLLVNKQTFLSFGLVSGVNNAYINVAEIANMNYDDPAFYSNLNKYKPTFGAGLYVYNKTAYAGFSVPNLVENYYQNSTVNWKHRRHYFFAAGKVFTLSDAFLFKPTTMLRWVQNAPLSVEATASFIYNEKFWFGATYRHADAIGALVCYQISPQLKIGYSYDISISKLSSYNSGSHELLLTYDFNFYGKGIVSPRYF